MGPGGRHPGRDAQQLRHAGLGQIARLPQADRDILEGYAAGMNAWLAKVKADPETWMPKQFRDFGFEPGPWTAFDVAMVLM